MTEKQVSIKLVQDIFANLCDFSGENLVSKPEDEAEEADEGGPDPPWPQPDGGEHLAPVSEQHGLQRVRGPAQGGQSGASVTVSLARVQPTQPNNPMRYQTNNPQEVDQNLW